VEVKYYLDFSGDVAVGLEAVGKFADSGFVVGTVTKKDVVCEGVVHMQDGNTRGRGYN
jgi:hypothetical protein